MFIYNVTIKVQEPISEEWLKWLKEVHIPDVLGTGCFTDAIVLQLLDVDDSEGPTYAVQYHAESRAAYTLYTRKFAGLMRQKSIDKWGEKFVAFRSFMQIVN